jgi:hypothetical protein
MMQKRTKEFLPMNIDMSVRNAKSDLKVGLFKIISIGSSSVVILGDVEDEITPISIAIARGVTAESLASISPKGPLT